MFPHVLIILRISADKNVVAGQDSHLLQLLAKKININNIYICLYISIYKNPFIYLRLYISICLYILKHCTDKQVRTALFLMMLKIRSERQRG